ncbi:MAG: MBL fold metallo-hydrolase [Candidatus Hydrogenedentes bacterium]|nr:MBL fold metallo-hydrolase [Candidatus Hydrogenedentota bacterium]
MYTAPEPGSVITIDCQFHMPQFAAAYLLVEKNEAAFVDNNTVYAVPRLMAALDRQSLDPAQVRYIIITHLHLDHAGATGRLSRICPQATVVAHPRAERHLIDPTRLISGVKAVYGDEVFAKDYDCVEPVPPDRIMCPADGDTIGLGDRSLTIMHTLGHAKHHICIHDSTTNGVFTGDSFGIMLPVFQRGSRPFVTCSSAPPDFDPDEAIKTVDRLTATCADRMYLTHFGEITRVDDVALELIHSIESAKDIIDEAINNTVADNLIERFCETRLREALRRQADRCGVNLAETDWDIMRHDISVNAQGLAAVARNRIGAHTNA